jgi:hypothetical protein
MRIALVNTNLCESPPAIPVGMEYVAHALETAGHEVRACDLTFSEDPRGKMLEFFGAEDFSLVGFSVRNVDTAVYAESEFFLPGAARLVAAAKEVTGAVTVAGGSATMAGPVAVREYLEVDCVVSGPGELAVLWIAEEVDRGTRLPAVVDGWSFGIDPTVSPRRGTAIDYSPYLAGGNPAGLEFRKGCDWGCPFCLERCRPVLAREPGTVAREAARLRRAGARMIFFCDSELNLDSGGTLRMLEALASAELGLEWTAYLRPVPFDAPIARLAAASGCKSVTLSVNSWELSGEGSRYSPDDVKSFCSRCRGEGIEVAVDLLTGYPGEPESSTEAAVALLAGAGAASVGVNAFIRLYGSTPVGLLLRERPEPEHMYGAAGGNPSMLEPVFYCKLDEDRLEGMIRGLDGFFIEGKRRRVNYQQFRDDDAGGDSA